MKRILRISFGWLISLEALGFAGLVREDADMDFTWLGLIATAGFVWFLLERLKAPWGIWAAGFVMILLDALSAVYLLYTRIPAWDMLMHSLGGVAIALGALELFLRLLRHGGVNAARPGLFAGVGTVLLTAAVGLMYEFLEYLVDRIYYGYPKTLVSAYDTIEDQMFNLLGAAVVLAGYRAWQGYRRGSARAFFTPAVAQAKERHPRM